MSMQMKVVSHIGVALLTALALPACKTFQEKSKDAGTQAVSIGDAGIGTGGRGGADAGSSSGGGTAPVSGTSGAGAPSDAAIDTNAGGAAIGGNSGDIGASGGNGVAGTPPGGNAGTSGGPSPDCVSGSTRLCKSDPALGALGNCGEGTEACVAGKWGACSVQPAAKDSCALLGDDASCNGKPNEGCPCVDGMKQPCGPPADVGICVRGSQTCAAGAWGACVGAVYAAARDCTSTMDSNCDGAPDNTLDAICVCAGAATRPCDDHPGKDGTGPCKAGSQTCAVAVDKKTSAWGACSGSVAPAAKDTCDPGNDANCSGVPNEGCACVAGATQACGPAANVGICKRGTQTCAAGTWGACTGAISAAARDCTSAADNNCDGLPDNTVDAVCGCTAATSRACNQHPGKDGNGPCKAGTQSCVVSVDKKSSAWATCAGDVAPAAADTCDGTNDNNCNGIPHDACACVNGTTQACGASALGICKKGTQTCTAGSFPTACTGEVKAQARDCTSTSDNDCNGIVDKMDATCVCTSGATMACPGTTNPSCISGIQTCTLAANKGSTSWVSTCTPKAGSSCGTASCTTDASGNTTVTSAGTCNASGGCTTASGGTPCANNRSCASATACNTTCSSTIPCAGGYYCSGTTCSLKKDDGQLCASPSECKHSICGGRCCATQPCICPQPSAQNLFRNADPGFDMSSTLSAWTDPIGGPGSTAYVMGDDADGCIYSGAIEKPYSNDSFGNPSMCANISAGGTYTFGFSLKNTMMGLDVFNCAIFRWDHPNCVGGNSGDNFIAGSYIGLTGTAPIWSNRITTFTVPTDGSAASLQMRCPDGDAPVFLDKVFLTPGSSGSF